MLEQENTQRVKDIYAAFGRGDMPTLLEALADDVEWVVAGPSDLPTSGMRRGKQAVQTWFGTLVENREFHVFEPQEFIAQGDKVVVLLQVEFTTRRSGRKVVMHEAHLWALRDGKFIRHESFEDTAAIADAYRGR
ncbi:MAG: nuclear transport factor 2 family protein [Chloroflexi bacterium]|nr:nuclear transport factor 2 family protein [Chloroflexota bacterium]